MPQRIAKSISTNGQSFGSTRAAVALLVAVLAPPLQAAKPARPAAPSNLAASALSSAQIKLVWSDNSGNESGFMVQRALSASGPWSQVGTTSANTRSYTNAGLAAATMYYYRVCAYNSRGVSAYSGAVSATTLPPPCTYSIFPSSSIVTSEGGSGLINVTAASGCVWAAASDNAWTSITGGSTGNGNGAVSYSVAANTTTNPRTNTLTVAGQIFTITQAAAVTPCSYSIAPASNAFNFGGGIGSVSVAAASGCGWIASSSDSWISITSGSAGNGSGTVGYSVVANATTNSRSGTLFVAGQRFTIAQAGDSPPLVSGGHVWSCRFGGTVLNWDDVFPAAIKEDSSGNVVLVGCFKNSSDFGAGTLSSAGKEDIFVLKRSPSGDYLWSLRIGGAGSDLATAVAVDSRDNILVGGTFVGTVDFGNVPLTSAGSSDIFLAKFSPTGTLLMARRFGGTATEQCQALALDAADNVVIAGGYGFYGTAIDFGGGPLTLSGGQTAFQYDVYVARLTPTGEHLWSRGHGGSGYDQANGVAVDANGDIVVVGDFQQTLSLGGDPLVSAGGYDVFVAKYSGNDGSHVWSQRGGGTANDLGKAVAFDPNGNVVATGEFNSTANFGGSPVVSVNNLPALFLAKYSPTGVPLWSRGFSATGPTGIVSGRGVAVDSRGDIVVTGGVSGNALFDGVYLGYGTIDILLAKFTGRDGSRIWAKFFGGQVDDYGVATTIGAADNILVTGSFSYSVDFGGGLLQSPGGYDGFVVKITP